MLWMPRSIFAFIQVANSCICYRSHFCASYPSRSLLRIFSQAIFAFCWKCFHNCAIFTLWFLFLLVFACFYLFLFHFSTFLVFLFGFYLVFISFCTVIFLFTYIWLFLMLNIHLVILFDNFSKQFSWNSAILKHFQYR